MDLVELARGLVGFSLIAGLLAENISSAHKIVHIMSTLASDARHAMHPRMDEKHYHVIADATLMHCFDQLDKAFEAGAMDDLELQNGILTIHTRSGRTYLVSKHAPSLQLWLASPVSGGLHFSFSESKQQWLLPDGRTFYAILRAELKDETIEVVL